MWFDSARRLFEQERSRLQIVADGRFVAIYRARILGIFATCGAVTDCLSDRSLAFGQELYVFKIQSESSEDAKILQASGSNWELLAEPYLDTDMPEWKWRATRALKLRKIGGLHLWLMKVATLSLVWNMLWGEWAALDGWDVLRGWLWILLLVPSFYVGAETNGGIGFIIFVCLAVAINPIFRWYINKNEKKP